MYGPEYSETAVFNFYWLISRPLFVTLSLKKKNQMQRKACFYRFLFVTFIFKPCSKEWSEIQSHFLGYIQKKLSSWSV